MVEFETADDPAEVEAVEGASEEAVEDGGGGALDAASEPAPEPPPVSNCDRTARKPDWAVLVVGSIVDALVAGSVGADVSVEGAAEPVSAVLLLA